MFYFTASVTSPLWLSRTGPLKSGVTPFPPHNARSFCAPFPPFEFTGADSFPSTAKIASFFISRLQPIFWTALKMDGPSSKGKWSLRREKIKIYRGNATFQRPYLAWSFLFLRLTLPGPSSAKQETRLSTALCRRLAKKKRPITSAAPNLETGSDSRREPRSHLISFRRCKKKRRPKAAAHKTGRKRRAREIRESRGRGRKVEWDV